MAKVTGNLGSQTFTEKQVIDRTHPPIVIGGVIAADSGELPAGLILAKNASGEFIPFVSGGTAPADVPIGVLVQAEDATDDTDNAVGRVLIHGTVVKESLLVGVADPQAPSDADLEALRPWIVAV